MAVLPLGGAAWTRKHDLPGKPLFQAATIFYPRSLSDLIQICAMRTAGAPLKAAGSHWALSTAAVSDDTFIETNDPNNVQPGMTQTLYDVIPDCMHPQLYDDLKNRHPPSFNKTTANPNGGLYFVHCESGKRVYQLYSELDAGDTAARSLASRLTRDGNPDYQGPWAFATLGGAGGQTVFGALNTGTHGGDHRQPPMSDAVVAVHLVADGGKHFWIEPRMVQGFENPLTDEGKVRSLYGAAAFGGPQMFEFIRDDDVFKAVLVSAGRFGVVYSVVMMAVRQYCLHEQRVLQDWHDVKKDIANLSSALYVEPAEVVSVPATGALSAGPSRFLQIVVSLTPYGSFGRNLAAVTKRWNVPAVPNESTPNGRRERTGANSGNSISYSADPDKPDQAKPMSFLERACTSANFMDGVIEAVAFEIKEFVEDNTIPIGGVIAAVGLIAGTAGLAALAVALAALLALLFAFLAKLRADGNARLGQVVDDLRSTLLGRSDPDEQAAGIFIWQCIYYKLFKSQQDDFEYAAISYAVMDQHNYLDNSCNVNVESIEVFFDATDSKLTAYIDALIAFEEGQEFLGRSFSGYASLRFTGPSVALLGMQRWPVTCAVEIAGLKDVQGTTELVEYAISLALNRNYRGILHWGQRNSSTRAQIEDRFGASALTRKGDLQTWRTALAKITENGRLNRFSSAFTRETGLEI